MVLLTGPSLRDNGIGSHISFGGCSGSFTPAFVSFRIAPTAVNEASSPVPNCLDKVSYLSGNWLRTEIEIEQSVQIGHRFGEGGYSGGADPLSRMDRVAGLGVRTRQFGEYDWPWSYAEAKHPGPADALLTRSKFTLCAIEGEVLGRRAQFEFTWALENMPATFGCRTRRDYRKL
jgi:hypothetical protein